MFAAAALLFALGMKETNKKVIQTRYAKRYRLSNSDATSQLSTSQKLKLLITSTLLRPWKMFFTEVIVGALAFYISFNFAIYYSLFAAFPYIFITQYGFGLGAQGLTFLGLAVGNIVGFIIVVLLVHVRKRKIVKAMKAEKAVNSPPEQRLLVALLGTILVPIGLFWIAWTARHGVHWIVCIIGSAFFAAGNFLVFVSI